MPTVEKNNDVSATLDKQQRVIKKKNKRIRTLYVLVGILILIIIGGGAVGYMQYRQLANENKRLSNPEESAKAETQRLKDKIAKLVDVPKDEEPTIATVTDKEKLKDQAFFAKAENGDKVFIYNKAKKAILYRPSTDKVIELNVLTEQNAANSQEKSQSSGATSSSPSNGQQGQSSDGGLPSAGQGLVP